MIASLIVWKCGVLKQIILQTATASVDFATDHKIQTTIQEEFNNSTLLTIAHRLRTIIQYDRVLVLGKSLRFSILPQL